jgi:peptidoglycan/LPS O-acetylase OafA/YrhL
MEFFDPRTRWTDGVPVRVVGVVIVLALVAVLCPFILLQQWPGLAAGGSVAASIVTACAQLLAGVLALAAIKPVYRQTRTGWGMAMVVLVLLLAGAVISIHFSDPAAQLQTWGVFDGAAVRDALRDQQNWQIVTAILFGVCAAGYLFWIRGLFGAPAVIPERPEARP